MGIQNSTKSVDGNLTYPVKLYVQLPFGPVIQPLGINPKTSCKSTKKTLTQDYILKNCLYCNSKKLETSWINYGTSSQ